MILSGGLPMGPDDFYGHDFILTIYAVAEYSSIIYTSVIFLSFKRLKR